MFGVLGLDAWIDVFTQESALVVGGLVGRFDGCNRSVGGLCLHQVWLESWLRRGRGDDDPRASMNEQCCLKLAESM
jgi:hypothetical protein